MKNHYLFCLVVVLMIACESFGGEQSASEGSAVENSISIVPMPAKMKRASGHFCLTSKTSIVASESLARVLRDYLKPATGYGFDVADSGNENCIVLKTVSQLVGELGDEGYKLLVTEQNVKIQAATEAGLFYGVQSLRQLLPPEIYKSNTDEEVSWTMPCVEIVDKPRFEWRGMLLDPARHFISISYLRKYIDLMAMHKLNRLQLHLTDGQGWRIEINKYPKLATQGRNKGNFYTQKEMRELVAYAAERNVVIVPEIEAPGHAGAAFGAYPEWRAGGSINLQEKTIAAFQDIYREVMDVFSTPYVHVGGDEVSAGWLRNEADLKVIKKYNLGNNTHAIQEWLQDRLMKPILTNKKVRPMMWYMNERWDVEKSILNKDTIIYGWFKRDTAMKAVNAGYDVVMAPMKGTYFDYRTQRDSPISGIDINTLKAAYEYDPLPAELTNATTTKRILGVQGQLWGERLSSVDILESKGFPRTSALAEVAWTPRRQKNYEQFTTRLKKQYQRFDLLGVNYYKLKTPMTLVATETLDVKNTAGQQFEWNVGPHLKGAGEYEIMFHMPIWNHNIEVSQVQLICDGKVVVSSDWVGNTRSRGGKINGLTKFKLTIHNPTGTYLLNAVVKNQGRGNDCVFEFCIRKRTTLTN